MSRIFAEVKNYFIGFDYIIFRNVKDAVLGTLVLILFPSITLVTVLALKENTFAAYWYQLFVICVSGFYDAFGRFGEKGDKKNRKLVVRSIIYIIAIALATVFIIFYKPLLWLPPVILICDCASLIVETVNRIRFSYKLRK